MPPQDEEVLAAMEDTITRIAPSALANLLHGSDPPLVLDVRHPTEFIGPLGHIDGASIFPLEELSGHIRELNGLENRRFITVCRQGDRAVEAARMLVAAGFPRVESLDGGLEGWLAQGLPVRGQGRGRA